MSDSVKKGEEKGFTFITWEPIKRINNTLTTLQAINIINRLELHCKNEELLKEVEVLKEWIKSKQ